MSKSGRIVGALFVAVAVFIFVNALINAFSLYNPEEISPAVFSEIKNTKPLSKDGATLLSFNTGHGVLGESASINEEGGRTKRPSAEEVLVNTRGIAELINLSKADAVLLQDVDTDSHRSRYVNQLAFYKDSGSKDCFYAEDFKSRSTSLLFPNKKINGGNAILTAKKVESAKRVSLPYLHKGLSFNKPHRSMLVCSMPIENTSKKLHIINFELDAYLEPEQKSEQLKAVMDYAEKLYQRDDYVIIGGSFYKTFAESDARYELSEKNVWKPEKLKGTETPIGWSLAFDETVPTCRILSKPVSLMGEEKQAYVADGFVLSPNLELKMVVTVDQEFRYSAHNPVLLKVKFK